MFFFINKPKFTLTILLVSSLTFVVHFILKCHSCCSVHVIAYIVSAKLSNLVWLLALRVERFRAPEGTSSYREP